MNSLAADADGAATATSNIVLPPTQDELPYDDGVPMESERHRWQADLLITALAPWLAQRPDGGYVGGNLFLYFNLAQVRNQDFRGPDVFVVLDVPRGERKSWVVWEEGKGPDVVIELLSESTASQDKHRKRLIYQNQLRVPEYFWFDPFDAEDWAGFALRNKVYEPLSRDAQGRLISDCLGLALVQWTGSYRGITATWLRWATLDNQLLLTAEEQAEGRAERLAAQLRALGVEPDEA
jgi:Uma2 family endonuclease